MITFLLSMFPTLNIYAVLYLRIFSFMVKFLVECRTSVGRLGQINEWSSRGESLNHSTPSFLVYTRVGHIPHLTWDVVEKSLHFLQTPILQFTLPSL